jgi:hypothetical protein
LAVELQIPIKTGVDRVRSRRHQQSVTVRWCTNDLLGRDIGGRTCPVLDNERLTHLARQPLADQARNDIGVASSGEANDQVNRTNRI